MQYAWSRALDLPSLSVRWDCYGGEVLRLASLDLLGVERVGRGVRQTTWLLAGIAQQYLKMSYTVR